MHKTIGGEFELELVCPTVNEEKSKQYSGFLYSSGRAALYHILLSIKTQKPKFNTLYIPDYICDSVIQTIEQAKIEWTVYHLDKSLRAKANSFNNIDPECGAILMVNYFGMMDLSAETDYLKRTNPDLCIIEDNVQSAYSMFETMRSNYRFTSFRKGFPMPDGGWAQGLNLLNNSIRTENNFAQYKLTGGFLKNYREYGYYDDNIYLDLLHKGEELINDNMERSISRYTYSGIRYIDYLTIAMKRRNNAKYIVKALKEIGIDSILPLTDKAVPLFIPIKLANRNKIRSAMFKENIYCPVHWPMPQTHNAEFVRGKEMSEQELSIIIDQRYDSNDMDRIINVIKDNL